MDDIGRFLAPADAVYFHGTLTPIRRRHRPYANEVGSPWMAGTWNTSIDLTSEQHRRLMAMLTTPTSRPIVMGEPFRVFHEPENP